MRIFYLLLFLFSFKAFGQNARGRNDLYVYPEQQHAYANKTRSLTGRPGEKYWQNRSKYKISATINPLNGYIEGNEKVKYFNNSPDSLKSIIIRTYPDFYKSSGVKDYTIDKSDSSDGMHISKIVFDNDSSAKYTLGGTNMYVDLPQKLAPKDSLSFVISWDFYLPKVTHIREGTFFKTSFFVAYWYPQISVYDDVNGWDYFNYTGLQEFYNDFNDYDVTINTPSNFLVWATGDWLNASEVLKKPYYNLYKLGLSSDTVMHVIDSAARKNVQLTNNKVNQYHFKAISVCDFSFAVSDTYLWDIISTQDPKKRGPRTDVNILYHPTQSRFSNLAVPAKNVIRHLSDNWPGIQYPFHHLSIFNGDGGMEYAMMVNQGYFGDEQAGSVMAHEIVHNYFPFLVGSNERRYAWMDEAFAQTLPNEIDLEVNHLKFRPQQDNRYYTDYFNKFIGTSLESPPMDLSINLKGGSYYFSAYTRPAYAFNYLREIIGDSVYKEVINEYVDNWKYKHPSPYDFFYTVNSVSKRNLDWFWKQWFFERSYPDISIGSLNIRSGNLEVKLEQIGNLPVPIILTLFFNDGTEETIRRSAGIWEKSRYFIINKRLPPGKRLVKAVVNSDQQLIPDINSENNTYQVK